LLARLTPAWGQCFSGFGLEVPWACALVLGSGLPRSMRDEQPKRNACWRECRLVCASVRFRMAEQSLRVFAQHAVAPPLRGIAQRWQLSSWQESTADVPADRSRADGEALRHLFCVEPFAVPRAARALPIEKRSWVFMARADQR